MYYQDLSKYTYTPINNGNNILNVGWLSSDYPFQKGDVPDNFCSRLLSIIKNKSVNRTRGFHQCELSNADNGPIYVDGFLLGSAEIHVVGQKNCVYASPNLIYHYVKSHKYLPPREYIDAVLACA